MHRVVFISVLMILTLTAAARHRSPGVVVADTSIIPVKTNITGQPLAEKLDSKKEKEVAGSTGKGAGTAKKGTKEAGKVIKTEKKGNVTVKSTTGTATKLPEKKATGSTSSAKVISKKAPGAATSASGTSKSASGSTKSASGASKTASGSSIKASTAAKNTSAAKSSTSLKSKTAKSTSKTRSSKPRKGIGIELFTPLAFKYAILLDVTVEKVTDDKLLEVLDHWYGTRYRYGGETRKGIDCSAFTQTFILSYLDYELPRTAEEQYMKCKHIKKKKLRQGDLVFFKTRGPKGRISHVGVYLVNDRFVHSATSTGVRISKLNDDYYRAKYAGAGRIK